MSEMGVEAGPLYVDVVADLTGFSRGLQEQINARVRGIRANITAEIDMRKAEAQLAAVERKQRQVTLGVAVDDAKAEAQLAAFAAKKRQAEITVEVNEAKAEVELARISAKKRTVTIDMAIEDAKAEAELDKVAGRRRVATIQAEADIAKAEAEIAVAAAKKRRATIDVDADTSKVTKKLDDIGSKLQGFGTGGLGLLQFPAIAAGISMAVGALAQLSAGLFSVVAAAAPAVGILGAIPGLVAGAAQGIGSIVVGFMGIGNAVKASSAAEAAAAATSGAASAQRAAAAQRIAAAQDRIKQSTASLANTEANVARQISQAQEGVQRAHEEASQNIIKAEQQVADAHTQAARDIEAAERRVSAAQRDAIQAQQDLVRARQEATRQLQDMNNQNVDQGFSVEEAQIGVQRAQIHKTQVDQSSTSTPLDKQQADLDLREAIQRLKEQQLAQQRLAKDTAAANKAGVEGSNQVVAARQKVQDANQKLIEEEQNLRDTRISANRAVQQADAALVQARIEGARKVADAEATLANAQRTGAFSVASAQHEVLLAQRDLADATANAALQANKQSTANTALAAAMGRLSPAGRAFVGFLRGSLEPAWLRVQKAVQQALLPPVQRGLQALMPLLGVLQTGMVRTATILGGAFEKLSRQYLATPIFRRDLSTIMATNNRVFAILATALIPITRALTDITVASGPLLIRFAQFIASGAKMAGAFIATQRASGGLARFFTQAGNSAAQLWRIFRDLAVAVFNIGKAAAPAGHLLLNAFEGAVAKFRAWTGSLQGQNTLKHYFDQAVPLVKEVGRLIRDVVRDFFKLGDNPQFASLIAQIRTQALPAILALGQNLNGAFGPSLVQGITHIIQLISQLASGGGSGSLTSFVNSLDHMLTIIIAISRNPFGGWVLRTAGSIAGMASALALVGGPLIKVSLLFAKVGGFAVGFARVAGGASVATSGITKLGGTVASKLIPVLSKMGGWLLTAGRWIGSLAGTIGRFALPVLSRLGGFMTNIASRVIPMMGQAIMWLGRLFLASGPWGWIILAVIALVTAFTLAYQHSQTFRNIVWAVLRAVGAVASWLWQQVQRAFGGIGTAFTNVGKMAGAMWGFIQRAFGSIGTAFSNLGKMGGALWGSIKGSWSAITGATGAMRDNLGKAFRATGGFFGNLGSSISDTYHRVISAVWNALRNAWGAVRDFFARAITSMKGSFGGFGDSISNIWHRVIEIIFNFFKRGFTNLRADFNRDVSLIKTLWSDMGSLIGRIWNGPIKTAFNAVKTAIGAVRDAFKDGVSKIGGFWDRLRGVVAAPVRFVIDTIYNNGIRGFWNNVAGKVGLPQLGKLTVKGINASRGAVIPGYAPGVDIVNAVLSPGEGVLVPEAVHGLAKTMGTSAENAIQAINAAFSSRVSKPSAQGRGRRSVRGGLPGYDIGGVFGAIGSGASWVGHQIGSGASAAASFVGDKVGAAVHALAGAVRGLLSGPLHAAAGPIHDLINRVLPANPWFSGLMRRGSNKLVDDVIGKIVGKDQAQNAAPPTGGMVMSNPVGNAGSGVTRWTSVVLKALAMNGLSMSLLNKVLFQMQTESGGNPNIIQQIHDVNSGGNEARGLMQVIPPTFRAFHFPGTSWNIFDPLANVAAALKYAKSRYGSSLYFLGQGHGYSLGGLAKTLGGLAGRALGSPLAQGALGKVATLFDSGGVLNPGTTMVHNATGQPEVVFTSNQWDTLSRIVTNASNSTVIHEPSANERLRGAQIDIHVNGAQGQDPREIAREVAVELGWLLR